VATMQRSSVVEIAPCFRVSSPADAVVTDGVSIVLRAGGAFGDGRHETTQLCLQAVAAFAPRPRRAWRLLDFGSGTGILSIAAAKLGATAHGVEIDREAIALAMENTRLSGVDERATFGESLASATGAFDLVVANILRRVLLAAADELAARLAGDGTLVLSGLVATDVPEVSSRYAKLLGDRRGEIYERGDWRALVWRGARRASS
jgi:ribosomal protein L11 methyltransferase